jgi:hypothetical protein
MQFHLVLAETEKNEVKKNMKCIKHELEMKKKISCLWYIIKLQKVKKKIQIALISNKLFQE